VWFGACTAKLCPKIHITHINILCMCGCATATADFHGYHDPHQ